MMTRACRSVGTGYSLSFLRPFLAMLGSLIHEEKGIEIQGYQDDGIKQVFICTATFRSLKINHYMDNSSQSQIE